MCLFGQTDIRLLRKDCHQKLSISNLECQWFFFLFLSKHCVPSLLCSIQLSFIQPYLPFVPSILSFVCHIARQLQYNSCTIWRAKKSTWIDRYKFYLSVAIFAAAPNVLPYIWYFLQRNTPLLQHYFPFNYWFCVCSVRFSFVSAPTQSNETSSGLCVCVCLCRRRLAIGFA